jgi:predicted transcriptional regulator
MSDYSYVRIFRALANGTHFALFKMIVESKGIYCSEIGKTFPISQSAISPHLKEFRNVRLIRQKKKNNNLSLSARSISAQEFNPGSLKAILRSIDYHWCCEYFHVQKELKRMEDVKWERISTTMKRVRSGSRVKR